MTPTLCRNCKKELTHDEMAMYRKMVNRAAEDFLCLPCLSRYFSIDEDALKEKIEYFKKSGCTLFG
jgi:hypothetical protein